MCPKDLARDRLIGGLVCLTQCGIRALVVTFGHEHDCACNERHILYLYMAHGHSDCSNRVILASRPFELARLARSLSCTRHRRSWLATKPRSAYTHPQEGPSPFQVKRDSESLPTRGAGRSRW